MSSKYAYDATEWWTTRDFRTSARLHLQHWLWNYQLGYVLHRSIPINSPNLRIADVAAGNGDWLIELSRQVPPTAQLQGFDLTAVNFPDKGWLPNNISMHVLDAFTPDLPADVVGVFDIVHVRAIARAVKDNHVHPLITNLVKMLKPGGYLQWDESDPSTVAPRSPNSSVQHPGATQLMDIIQEFSKVYKLQADWLHDLPTTFNAHDLDLVVQESFDPRKELMKAWTDNLLVAYEERAVRLPKDSDGAGGGFTREKYKELFERVLAETQQGVSLSMSGLVTVGRKRES